MRTTEWLLLFVLSVIWGATFFFAVIAVREVPPLTLVLVRVALAAAVLVPVALALGYRLPREARVWRSLVALCLFSNVIPFSLMFSGQPLISGGLASVVNATTPLFTILAARIAGHETLTTTRVTGVLMGLAGVGVLMGPAAFRAESSSLLGMACFLAAACSYGASGILLRRFRDLPPMVSAGGQLLCSSIIMLPIAAIIEQPWTMARPSAAAMAAVVGLAVLSTSIAYVIFFRITATAGATNVMLVTLLVPVTATALGVVFLDEPLSVNQIVGALIIGFALIIIDGRMVRWVLPR